MPINIKIDTADYKNQGIKVPKSIFSESIYDNPYNSPAVVSKYSYIDELTKPIMDKKSYYAKPKPIKVIQPELIQEKVEEKLDINLYSLKEFNFIDKVAYELEGGWLKERNDLHPDLSFSKDDFHPRFKSVGEYVAKPFNNSKDFITDLDFNWPDSSINKCGFHIHFSLKSPAYYNVCMEHNFYKEFLIMLDKWGRDNVKDGHSFWARLQGMNKYCQSTFIPDIQAAYREKGHNRHSRRTILNYCYGYLKTIECRVLPMFEDKKLAISASLAIFDFVEAYLSNNKLKNISFSSLCQFEIPENKVIPTKSLVKNESKFKLGTYNYFTKGKIVKENKKVAKTFNDAVIALKKSEADNQF